MKIFKIISYVFIVTLCLAPSAFAKAYTPDEDPYQANWDDHLIKTYFLHRLANSPEVATDPQFTFRQDESELRYPNWQGGYWMGLEGYNLKDYSPSASVPQFNTRYYTKSTSSHPQGIVYVTPDSSTLDNLFELIAKKIKTKIVE